MDVAFWEWDGGSGSCGPGYLGYSENDFYEAIRYSEADTTGNLQATYIQQHQIIVPRTIVE